MADGWSTNDSELQELLLESTHLLTSLQLVFEFTLLFRTRERAAQVRESLQSSCFNQYGRVGYDDNSPRLLSFYTKLSPLEREAYYRVRCSNMVDTLVTARSETAECRLVGVDLSGFEEPRISDPVATFASVGILLNSIRDLKMIGNFSLINPMRQSSNVTVGRPGFKESDLSVNEVTFIYGTCDSSANHHAIRSWNPERFMPGPWKQTAEHPGYREWSLTSDTDGNGASCAMKVSMEGPYSPNTRAISSIITAKSVGAFSEEKVARIRFATNRKRKLADMISRRLAKVENGKIGLLGDDVEHSGSLIAVGMHFALK